ncbi:MAG TPA: N-acetyl-gamma-glutamyl-phosphate reductase [Solirubrobacteraceae bacterium]|nr:N-acetyl-gamma-glutamyl-phosphate reductase [Solirubrobacteraceae bacterium]
MRSVAVFGATGYAGALSAALVERHPSLALRHVTARGGDVGRRLSDLYPRYRVGLELEELDLDVHADVDAAIVAYPHGAAAEVVSELVTRGVRVVDLSADFRLRDPAVYAEWYREHPNPELIADAVYGLPELYREQLRDAQLVANPGCYPTAAILSLAPLARAGLISDVVIDAKSGVSGAGRAATEKTHFVTVDENLSPYGVPRHRHTPEIEQELSILLGLDLKLTFTPHLIPLDQGELVSCYVTLPPCGGPNKRTISIEQIREVYASAYAREPFVELTDAMPGVRDVRDTNICRISVNDDERTGRVIVFGVIDNLWKGAASQAVQNLNLMLGLPEGEGIS